MTKQLLKARLRISHVIEYLADDLPPALDLAGLAGLQPRGQIPLFLTAKGGPEALGDGGGGKPAAEAASDLSIDQRRRRLGKDQGADRVEENGAGAGRD